MQSGGGGQAVAGAQEVGAADVGVTTGGHLVSGLQLMRPEDGQGQCDHQVTLDSLCDAGPQVGVGAAQLVLLEAEAAAVAGQGQPPVLPVRAGHVPSHVRGAASVAVNLDQGVELISTVSSKLWGLMPKL